MTIFDIVNLGNIELRSDGMCSQCITRPAHKHGLCEVCTKDLVETINNHLKNDKERT